MHRDTRRSTALTSGTSVSYVCDMKFRAVFAVAAGVVVWCCAPQPLSAQPVPAVSPTPQSPTLYGPLSTTARVAESSQFERQQTRQRNEMLRLTEDQIHDDLMLLTRVMDLFFVARTPEQEIALTVRKQTIPLLEGLAPYSIESTYQGISSLGQRVPFCTRPPGEVFHCDPYFQPHPPAAAPYEVKMLSAKIGMLVIRDLSDSTNPAWAKFAADVAPLASAAGLVIDLRTAWGSDPRSLVPWLEQLTGRAPLAALREIRRAPQLTPYVDAYRARYRADARDPAVWATLVGTPAQTRPRTAPQIAVMIGRHCESACELATRLLETYARATVLGNPGSSGRLGYDEPALLELPRSKIMVYFYATEYLLSADIEAATGPTAEWHQRRGWLFDSDPTALAIREVERRIKRPRWPPSCVGLQGYETVAALPLAVRKKIHNAYLLKPGMCTERSGITIGIKADVSLDTMRKLTTSCGISSVGQDSAQVSFAFPGFVGIKPLSRLAQSDVVDEIYVSCQAEYEPNGPGGT